MTSINVTALIHSFSNFHLNLCLMNNGISHNTAFCVENNCICHQSVTEIRPPTDNPLNNYCPKFLLLGNITALMTNNKKIIAAKTNTVRVTLPTYTYSQPPPHLLYLTDKKNNI